MSNQELLQIYSAYLPYGVKVLVDNGNGKYTDIITGIGIIDDMIFLDETGDWYYNDENDFDAKLVLRPLSDLTKEIEHNRKKFVPVERIEEIFQCDAGDEYLISAIMSNGSIEIRYYQEFQKLLEWHFDVFGLLDKNLAINLNEVK